MIEFRGNQLLYALVVVLSAATMVSILRNQPQYDSFVSSISQLAVDAPAGMAPWLSGKETATAEGTTSVHENSTHPQAPPDAISLGAETKGLAVATHTAATTLSTDAPVDLDTIASKWELPEGSVELLQQIQSRPLFFDYNRTHDILGFRHPLKTGGTSLSRMLDEMFDGKAVPGSGPSTWFNTEKFKRFVKTHDPLHNASFWDEIGVLYTHTLLRPSTPNKTDGYLLEKLRRDVPVFRNKRFRLITVVRRPLDLAASSFYETKCRVGRFADQRSVGNNDLVNKGQAPVCPPVNLTDVMWKNIEHFTEKCDRKKGTKDVEVLEGAKCRALRKDPIKAFEHCGSLDLMLEKGLSHNQHFKSFMGAFPRPPDVHLKGENLTPTLEDVALYTLKDLGGLMDFHDVYKEDFVWFAITERFKESMCLFYYYFQKEPVKERKSLYKPCRPLTFWEDRHKNYILEHETFDYTVWRAANAILDVRMASLRTEIKARLDAGEVLEEIPFLGPGCYTGEFQVDYAEENTKGNLGEPVPTKPQNMKRQKAGKARKAGRRR